MKVNFNSFFGSVAGMLAFVLMIGGIIGWCMNIYKLFGESFDPLTAIAVGRVVGVFMAPLGAVIGWF